MRDFFYLGTANLFQAMHSASLSLTTEFSINDDTI